MNTEQKMAYSLKLLKDEMNGKSMLFENPAKKLRDSNCPYYSYTTKYLIDNGILIREKDGYRWNPKIDVSLVFAKQIRDTVYKEHYEPHLSAKVQETRQITANDRIDELASKVYLLQKEVERMKLIMNAKPAKKKIRFHFPKIRFQSPVRLQP